MINQVAVPIFYDKHVSIITRIDFLHVLLCDVSTIS
ncbi:MAG: hypothetical protein ACJAVV_001198 [Alphaproteobacteria bacterium]|jgi:hypothetical protein